MCEPPTWERRATQTLSENRRKCPFLSPPPIARAAAAAATGDKGSVPGRTPHSPQQQAAVPLGRVPYKGSVLRQSGVEQEKKQKAPPATARAALGGQSECCITEVSLFVSFRSLFYPLSHRVDGETTVFTIYVDFLSKITVTWP